jgi:hypothetical protein
MYSAREGLYNEDLPVGSSGSPGSSTSPSWWYLYGGLTNNAKVPVVGVLSVIDIDMGNLDLFLKGTWDGQFLGGLKSADIPDNGGSGCILYVSDRRGDRDNDGEYDMEDIYGPNDGTTQPGEDVNRNGALDVDYTWEADRYDVDIATDLGAVQDHKYLRRAVRVINGQTLTSYGTLNRGYSVASENGLYTLGNFNATGITTVGTPSQPGDYSGAEVPASLVADAVTILSKQWNDAKSFRNPCEYGNRVVDSSGETAVRAALLMGDTRSSLRVSGRPNQGGGDSDLAGGVHNFPRFLENWGGNRFSYCGSLINLFNGRQHDGHTRTEGRRILPQLETGSSTRHSWTLTVYRPVRRSFSTYR